MHFRRILSGLPLAAALLIPQSASAASDGDLCADPLSFLVCLTAAAVAAPVEAAQQFWWNHASAALEADQFDRAVRIAREHPEQARVDDLIGVEVERALAPGLDSALKARRMQTLDQLVAARPAAWGATQTTQETLVKIAQRPGQDAASMLRRLLDDGLSSSDVYRPYLDYQRVCPDAATPCPRLVLLLDHGLVKSPESLAALLVDTVLAGHWGDANYLLQRGADPNVEGIRTGLAMMTLSRLCLNERDESHRDDCVERRDTVLRYFVAHGADPNGRPAAVNRCVTPIDFSYDAYDLHLTNVLEALGADAHAGARCRAATGVPPLAPGTLSRH
jgi:hypothetical protein